RAPKAKCTPEGRIEALEDKLKIGLAKLCCNPSRLQDSVEYPSKERDSDCLHGPNLPVSVNHQLRTSSSSAIILSSSDKDKWLEQVNTSMNTPSKGIERSSIIVCKACDKSFPGNQKSQRGGGGEEEEEADDYEEDQVAHEGIRLSGIGTVLGEVCRREHLAQHLTSMIFVWERFCELGVCSKTPKIQCEGLVNHQGR
ncbi:hypothetical protein TCAL_15969, partial [Tigriopus californicus]